MAHDEGSAETLREDLADLPGLTEKRMFGGLCFMVDGNMACGITAERGMFRVGKQHEDEAAAIDGVIPMIHAGRRMGGFVRADLDCIADDDRRGRLMALVRANLATLPPK
ncbi:TfoX/Sxy family protein [Pelagovum pacificum]|uniref:TfoX/Sxy family protein n=1 Tax=Pelagovum pacificum TaxID=2588711 RepID=A0A5C5GBT1_9RHOB|nr:TfoX/Sxy family protein [Pelagovum pacificum]QQA44648.1 TfoX/Sxy family protein [Pelagovum pacificum]TNY32242.1 TfoX/Sxy family protein [Pelagovum pacificum]